MKSANPTTRNKAVVIGACMAGLVAARALADFYSEVLILERDTFPVPGGQRKGVPQGRHLHNLLPAGQEILEKLFPGLTGQLISQGAQTIDSQEVAWFFKGAYHRPFTSNTKGIAARRPLLEATVQRRVLALPNVQAIENCDVLGVVANEARLAVAGVRLLRHKMGSAAEIMGADLVVDATGRGSRTPVWLEELGYARPPEAQVRIGMGYTSRYYRRLPGQLPGKKALVITAELENPRLGVAMAEETESWIVTLGGYFGNHAPTDDQGFLAFARSLTSPDLYEFLKEAEPTSAPIQHKFPFSQRRHYQKLQHFPTGLVVFGDALCSFNPIYGQGMSVAAQQAVALHNCLSHHDNLTLAPAFFKCAAKIIDNPWQLVGGGDLRFPAAEGKRTQLGKFLSWYVDHLHNAAHHSPEVFKAFAEVTGLLAAPPTLLRPKVAGRVLWYNLRSKKTATALNRPASSLGVRD